MPYKFERPYGVTAICDFTLWEVDGVDVNSTASAVLGDVVIFKNEDNAGDRDSLSVSANATNLFSANASGAWYSIQLTPTEMEAARVVIQITDTHNSPKEWLDEFIFIDTYGANPSAQRHFSAVAETTLGFNFENVSAVSDRSLLNAARFLRNRWQVVGSALSVFAEDDVTTAWTVALDTVTSAAPVVDFNPD